MTRMTGPDCAIMCNLINIHTYIHYVRARLSTKILRLVKLYCYWWSFKSSTEVKWSSWTFLVVLIAMDGRLNRDGRISVVGRVRATKCPSEQYHGWGVPHVSGGPPAALPNLAHATGEAGNQCTLADDLRGNTTYQVQCSYYQGVGGGGDLQTVTINQWNLCY